MVEKYNNKKLVSLPIIIALLTIPFCGINYPLRKETLQFIMGEKAFWVVIFVVVLSLVLMLLYKTDVNDEERTEVKTFNKYRITFYFLLTIEISLLIYLVMKELINPRTYFINEFIWFLGFLCVIKFIKDGFYILNQNSVIDTNLLSLKRKSGIRSIISGIILFFVILLTGNKILAAIIVIVSILICGNKTSD
jgi:hypothetical protein